ncbi:MAG: hypothetical protein AB7V50_10050 [Vampirovibrionia bacterium]
MTLINSNSFNYPPMQLVYDAPSNPGGNNKPTPWTPWQPNPSPWQPNPTPFPWQPSPWMPQPTPWNPGNESPIQLVYDAPSNPSPSPTPWTPWNPGIPSPWDGPTNPPVQAVYSAPVRLEQQQWLT